MTSKKFFKSVSVKEALDEISKIASNYSINTETLEFYNATNRVLATDIISKENIPNFNRSRMDGYAVKFDETTGSSETMPSIFNIVGNVEIGSSPTFSINNGECAYVPTGGEIPKGANSIVMIENTELISDSELLVYKSTSFNENITLKGEDISINEIVIKKYTKLNSFHIGVLASMGITEIPVLKKTTVSIISTGDELVSVYKKNLQGTEIRDINSYCLKSQLENIGCIVNNISIVKDNYDSLKKEILRTIDNSDFIIMSGGSSVGERDYMNALLAELGEVLFHGIRMKPGKPVLFGTINNKAFFGLPGNPVSCALAAELYVSSFVFSLNNINNKKLFGNFKLDTNLHSFPGKTTFQMVDINDGVASPIMGRSSMIKMLANSKGYIEIDESIEGLYKDSDVNVTLFK